MRFLRRRSRLLFMVSGAALMLVAAALGLLAGADEPPPRRVVQAAEAAQPAAARAPQPLPGMVPPRISASAAVVIDGESGVVLLDKNAFEPVPPASLTKIMTAWVVLQHADLKRRVTARFSFDELDPDGTAMGLRPGDELTVEDLLYGLMLPSGNDAALVLAKHVAGSEAAFVEVMNFEAKKLGLRDTHFRNASGLDAPAHVVSAHDIGQIARAAMRDPRFRQIVAAPSWTVRGTRSYTVYNKNAFLTAYSGADGVKIGWTEEAGATIVASATRSGHRVIVALLDTQDRVRDSAALMDWVFANYRWPGDR